MKRVLLTCGKCGLEHEMKDSSDMTIVEVYMHIMGRGARRLHLCQKCVDELINSYPKEAQNGTNN